MVSTAWIAPPRRTAETAAATLCLNRPPLALDTSPARSISAFISAETSAKYVGDARMMPSAAIIFATHSFRISSEITHLLFLVRKQP